MKKILIVFSSLLFSFLSSFANEGMWIPMLLDINDMQSNGLRLTQEDIYSIRQSSLKDAIVLFGSGCTGEVISEEGLILTNHHCGFSAIQSHSSVENDYLKNGFWAMSNLEELRCEGLSVSFIVSIEDVTSSILEGIDESTPLAQRTNMITQRSAKVAADAIAGTHYKAHVKSFYYGNQYFLIKSEVFTDIRLVGAPPSGIGNFGGDSDNWVWPRHTGDFSFFRIYAGADNLPAAYSESNQPMVPRKSLKISTKGVAEGDFTMVYGFPAVTTQYLISDAVDFIVNKSNPEKIEMRKSSLGIIDAAMLQSDEMRIKYAAKQSNISNAYKKWIGENMGLIRFDAINKKRAFESDFQTAANNSGKINYMQVLPALKELHYQIEPVADARDFFVEFVIYGPNILSFTRRFEMLVSRYDELQKKGLVDKQLSDLQKSSATHFKDFDTETDRKLFVELLQYYLKGTDSAWRPREVNDLLGRYNGDFEKMGRELYEKSVFADQSKINEVLKSGNSKKIKKLSGDMSFKLMASFYTHFQDVVKPNYDQLKMQIDDWMRIYVQAQMELFPDKKYWSDANSTLRISYGKVEGCIPQDGLLYHYQTTIEGVAQKYVPGDVDFDAPDRLMELYRNKDFGKYGVNGTLPVAFLASNHTTGGNSGSPVLNAEGHLIGLNFDRSWESTMSDVMFNAEICRNISVDIRYVLFVVDKFAGAERLINEMQIIQ
jgi:hypothetical protein